MACWELSSCRPDQSSSAKRVLLTRLCGPRASPQNRPERRSSPAYATTTAMRRGRSGGCECDCQMFMAAGWWLGHTSGGLSLACEWRRGERRRGEQRRGERRRPVAAPPGRRGLCDRPPTRLLPAWPLQGLCRRAGAVEGVREGERLEKDGEVGDQSTGTLEDGCRGWSHGTRPQVCLAGHAQHMGAKRAPIGRSRKYRASSSICTSSKPFSDAQEPPNQLPRRHPHRAGRHSGHAQLGRHDGNSHSQPI